MEFRVGDIVGKKVTFPFVLFVGMIVGKDVGSVPFASGKVPLGAKVGAFVAFPLVSGRVALVGANVGVVAFVSGRVVLVGAGEGDMGFFSHGKAQCASEAVQSDAQGPLQAKSQSIDEHSATTKSSSQ